VYDTRTLRAGETQVGGFFTHRTESSAESVARLTEREIVQHLFESSVARALILDELELSRNALHALHVMAPFTYGRQKPGDIDALLCDSAEPHHAVALECKRVKVIGSDSGTDRVNRLDDFGQAHDQANALAKLRFNRTFLACIAIVDARLRPVPNFALRGTSTATFGRLFDTAMTMPLVEEVGVLYIEIDQPVHAPIEQAANVSVGIFRESRRQEQEGQSTARIANFMRENGQLGTLR
jgi:hypothetical protein